MRTHSPTNFHVTLFGDRGPYEAMMAAAGFVKVGSAPATDKRTGRRIREENDTRWAFRWVPARAASRA